MLFSQPSQIWHWLNDRIFFSLNEGSQAPMSLVLTRRPRAPVLTNCVGKKTLSCNAVLPTLSVNTECHFGHPCPRHTGVHRSCLRVCRVDGL